MTTQATVGNAKTVSVTVPFIYRAQVIRPRCRKPIEISVRDVMDVEIKCLEASEMPVAFRMSKQEIFAHADSLWQKSFHTAYGEEPELATLEKVLALTNDPKGYKYSSPSPIAPFFNVWHSVKADWDKSWSHNQPWLEDKDSVQELCDYTFREMVGSNREQTMQHIREVAAGMVSVDGVIFERASEPRYYVITFGLGNNHGGTSLSPTTYYNRNIPQHCYFSAADRDAAISYALEVANNRGDNESIKSIESTEMIEVLMPEMVKVNPQVDHPVK